MLGAFPPQAQGIPDYCREIALALATRVPVHAIGFRAMYPAWLFPGVKQTMDATKAVMAAPNLRVEHRLRWWNPPGWAWRALRAPCDVFHLQWWSLPLFPIAFVFLLLMRLRRKKIVVTVHNVLPHEGGTAYTFASRMLCRMAHRVIVHSEANREQIIRHYRLPPDRVARIPIGSYMGGAPKIAPVEARRALGLPEGKIYLLNFGTIRPYKGLDDLLDAFARIAPQFPAAHLVIAGKPWIPWGPFAAQIRGAAIEDRVHPFLDYVPEDRIPLFFGAADLVVLPYTHFDAQSGVGAVALPYAKPMIVTSVGSLPEWVDHHPEWIVPPEDPATLAQRIAAFLERPAEATAAYQRIAANVQKNCSWESIADRHLELYR
jgi:glycosyltransferase involved in cell wall biosynthesis